MVKILTFALLMLAIPQPLSASEANDCLHGPESQMPTTLQVESPNASSDAVARDGEIRKRTKVQADCALVDLPTAKNRMTLLGRVDPAADAQGKS